MADASFSSVALLLAGQGLDGSQGFVDTSKYCNRVVPYSGVVVHSNAQAKYGKTSIFIPSSIGGNSGLSVYNAQFLVPANTAFTVEAWVKWSSPSGELDFFNFSASEASGRVSTFINSGSFGFNRFGNGSFNFGSAVNDGAWHHVAWTRNSSGVMHWWVDGTALGSTITDSGAMGNGPGGVRFFNGANIYASDLRVTIGVERYTSTFTPPTVALESATKLAGTVTDGGVAERYIRAMQRETGLAVGAGWSDPSTGAFSFPVGLTTSDELQLICLDDAAGTLENDRVHRVYPVAS